MTNSLTLSNLVFEHVLEEDSYLKVSNCNIDCNNLLKDLNRGKGDLLDRMEEASSAGARFRRSLLHNLYRFLIDRNKFSLKTIRL
jgi:hypothetical protein